MRAPLKGLWLVQVKGCPEGKKVDAGRVLLGEQGHTDIQRGHKETYYFVSYVQHFSALGVSWAPFLL